MVLKINLLRFIIGKTILYFHLNFSIEETVLLTHQSLPKSFCKAKEINHISKGLLLEPYYFQL